VGRLGAEDSQIARFRLERDHRGARWCQLDAFDVPDHGRFLGSGALHPEQKLTPDLKNLEVHVGDKLLVNIGNLRRFARLRDEVIVSEEPGGSRFE
jgi:hypothetical protein